MTQDNTAHTSGQHAYPDEFGIGQKAIARIRLEIAARDMAKAAPDAFSTGYVNPEWRAMQRRLFNAARAEADKAQAVLA